MNYMNYYGMKPYSSDYIEYTIVQGDYLYALAQRFNTTVEAIMQLNNLTSDRLQIGQKLMIPTNTINPPSGKPTIRFGSRGEAVVDLQRKLQTLGYNVVIIDGMFGLTTQTAVQAYQRNSGLTPDGIVGPKTWNALDNANTVTPPGHITYFVVQGDSLYELAQRFNTTVETLMRINNLTSDRLYIGQKILIPNN